MAQRDDCTLRLEARGRGQVLQDAGGRARRLERARLLLAAAQHPTMLGVGPNWSKCARSRSQVAQWKVPKSDCHKKESMTADPYMDTFVRDFA